MKNLKWSVLILCSITAILWSCDDDIDSLGDSIVGVDPNETIRSREVEVKAFSTPVNPVQTNNFDSYLLGQYNDPVYGSSSYTIVSQAVPSFLNPDFTGTDENQTPPELKSVYLEIPYFSRVTEVNGEDREYVLDSVYGDGNVDLKVFRNKYFLNNFDPDDITEPAQFYSDQKQLIETASTGSNAEILYQENNFEFSDQEIRIQNEDGDIVERKSPRIRVDLLSEQNGIANSLDYWSNLILTVDNPNFRSSGNFKNFFRGIYLTAEPSNAANPALAYLNFQEAAIIFSVDVRLANSEEPVASEYRFDLQSTSVGSVSTVNFINTDVPTDIQDRISNSFEPVNGSENLFLKGGAGAIALIDLFGQDELNELIEDRALINDAVLEFAVDQDIVEGGEKEPERIIIYNFETGNLLLDYNLANELPGINNNLAHLGKLERESEDDLDSNGVRYRIRITNHLNAIISDELNDDIPENEKLGNDRLAIAVSQNTSVLGISQVKDQTTPIEIERVLESSAISHEGTVLHGSQSPDIDKKPKLIIYYSTPN